MTTPAKIVGYFHTQKASLCLLVYALAVVFLALSWFIQDTPPTPWLFSMVGFLCSSLRLRFIT